jgi:hypothetical protein
MASSPAPKPAQMFDGYVMRDLWSVGDGGGDRDKDLVAASIMRANGHPTWKLYCGELTSKHSTPKYVYLDDKACYDVIASGWFTGTTKGEAWPFDFGKHGMIRASRPNRGRPAFIEDKHGETVVASARKHGGRDPAKDLYFFWGAGGDPNKTEADKKADRERKRRLGFEETEETVKRMRLEVEEAARAREESPGPMDLVRAHDARITEAKKQLEAEKAGQGSPGKTHPCADCKLDNTDSPRPVQGYRHTRSYYRPQDAYSL